MPKGIGYGKHAKDLKMAGKKLKKGKKGKAKAAMAGNPFAKAMKGAMRG